MPLAGLEWMQRGDHFNIRVDAVGLVQNGGLAFSQECRVLKGSPGPEVEMRVISQLGRRASE